VKVKVRETSQLSVPVGVPVLAGNVLAEHWTGSIAGQTMEGGEKSVTIMTCRHELLFPQPSLANQVRLIVIITGQGTTYRNIRECNNR
jgi:hypothetical protein